MEGDSVTNTLHKTFGKLITSHLESYEGIYSFLMYLIWALSLWFVLSWLTRIICKLFFPVVACFAFLAIFNEQHSAALRMVLRLCSFLCSKMSNQFDKFSDSEWNPYAR